MYFLNGFLIFCLLLFCPLDGFAKIYKWVDKNGKIHISSQKPVEHKEADIEKGWITVLHFQGVEEIAKSDSFQLQGTEGKIIWEVVRSKEKKKYLDKEIEHTEKEIEYTKEDLKQRLAEGIKEDTEETEKIEAGKKYESGKHVKVAKERKQIKKGTRGLERELIRLDKEIASLKKEKKTVSLKVTIRDNSGTFKETVLNTRKNRGRLLIREIKAGNYYLDVSTDPDCYWKIEILEKEEKPLD